MESTIRFFGNRRLQYIKIKKWEEDVRKGTDLIGLMHYLGSNREKPPLEDALIEGHDSFSFS
jgi:hypothetical protein